MRLVRRRGWLLGVAATTTALVVACTLNPQPLPPELSADGENADGGSFGAADGAANEPASSHEDAGVRRDASPSDPNDAGDDAGDASADADAGED